MSPTVRIGVIDDEPDICALVQIAARRDPAAELVFVALSLGDGLAALASTTVDVLLLDRRLPDADALEHVRELRAVAGHAELLMFTAEVPLQFPRPASDAGLDGFLDKTVLASITQTPLTQLLGRVAVVGAA